MRTVEHVGVGLTLGGRRVGVERPRVRVERRHGTAFDEPLRPARSLRPAHVQLLNPA